MCSPRMLPKRGRSACLVRFNAQEQMRGPICDDHSSIPRGLWEGAPHVAMETIDAGGWESVPTPFPGSTPSLEKNDCEDKLPHCKVINDDGKERYNLP
ncbi:hypothetical protein TNCV_1823231 [Trichonephila clavipes]|nr:hypothetical protein TNCV_1823231 [Trichonephila clavipes]